MAEQHPVEGLEKWFDDVGLEESSELQSLDQYTSGLTIKIPDGNRDPDLVELVNNVNRPSGKREDQRQNIDLLVAYIGSLAQEKEEQASSKQDDAKQAERRWEDRQEKRSRFSRKVHRVTKAISSSIKNAFGLVLRVLIGGMKVLDSVSFIASELTFQTHYQVALKAIMLFITAYESAGKLTDDITAMFDKIDGYGREMRALQDNIKSAPMSKAINKLFVSIVAFIVSAGSYLKHGILPKMVAYLGGRNDKFQGLLKAIKEAYDEVKRVMEFAQVMINLSSLQKISNVGHDTATIIHQLSLLNNSVPPDMSIQLREVHEHTRFHAELHIQTLRSELFDLPYEPSEELAFNDTERKFLSSNDRWQRHFKPLWPSSTSEPASELVLTTTHGAAGLRPLIWISGHVSRRNVSWVSSLCVDLVSYFRDFSNFDIAYVFCKRGQGPRYSPTLLIKGVVAQLLDMHPTIAMKNLRRLSLATFREIGSETRPGSALLAWKLLETILRLMEEAPELRNRAVLILIDRLDLCVSEEGFSVLDGFIPRLQGLGRQFPRVQVIVTTARLSAFSVPTLRRGPEWLQAYGKKTHR